MEHPVAEPVIARASAGPAGAVEAALRRGPGDQVSPKELERVAHPWARKGDLQPPLEPPLPTQEFPRGSIVPLGSRQIFEHPFVWFTGHFPLAFAEQERTHLREYVDRGGFIVIDDHNHDIDGEFHKTAHEEIARIFGPDALEEIPNDHAIYTKFFEFDRGPPATAHELNGWGDNLLHRHLFGVFRGDRIGLLYSSKDYTSEWSFGPDTKRFIAVDPTRFGVNLVVYALTS